MALKMIQVGTGGWGGQWCRQFLPPNVADGHVEVVAAVDINPAALQNARDHLGLPEEKCYVDIHKAFAENPADFCTVVVPPAAHESIVDVAVEYGLNILSEKPIADTLAGSVRIAHKTRRAGLKMGVTMSHRFDQDKTSLRNEIQSGRHGALDYLMCRFTCDCRKFASWGQFRHEIPDTLMIEGAVHHLDILADLAASPCETIYAETWNPKWGQYAGDSNGLVTLHMSNGVRAHYEGAKTNAAGLNGWSREYIRAECELATLVLDARELSAYRYDASKSWRGAIDPDGNDTSEKIALLQQKKWANTWLIEKFCDWLNGGPPMETEVERNLQSVALVFAAIESSRTGMPVRVQELLRAAQQEEEAACQ